jgi:uncharacterized protein YcgL (UPF0745 family)
MKLVEIFKSDKTAETYLYVDYKKGLRVVPEELLSNFGQTQSIMIIPLSKDKILARVDVNKVLQSIDNNGYFLQMPPQPHALVEAQITAMIAAENELTQSQNQKPVK